MLLLKTLQSFPFKLEFASETVKGNFNSAEQSLNLNIQYICHSLTQGVVNSIAWTLDYLHLKQHLPLERSLVAATVIILAILLPSIKPCFSPQGAKTKGLKSLKGKKTLIKRTVCLRMTVQNQMTWPNNNK